jgi:hypothetical protein
MVNRLREEHRPLFRRGLPLARLLTSLSRRRSRVRESRFLEVGWMVGPPSDDLNCITCDETSDIVVPEPSFPLRLAFFALP